MTKHLIIYLIAINIVTFIVYGNDKHRARNLDWRISESMLLFLAAVGGSVGAWAAMYFFRHKTRKKKFTIGVPLMLAVQVALFAWLFHTVL